MDKNRIELPICDSEYKSLPALTNLFSVLGNYPEGRIWMIENHLNLVAFYLGEGNYTPNDHMDFWVEFTSYDSFYIGRSWERCWMIRKKTHDRAFIDMKWQSFTDFCIDAIRMGMYIFVTVNTIPIHNYKWSGRHQLFIHGFDLAKMQFYCSDFFGNPPHYSKEWVSFDEIEQGYHSLFSVSQIDDFDGVCLWKYDADAFSYDFEYGIKSLKRPDFQHISHVLSCYLMGQNEKGQFGNSKIAYGKFAFTAISKYIKDKIMIKNEIKLQPFYVVRDYLSTIDMLGKELVQYGFTSSNIYNYNKIITEWDGIIRMVIKHNVINSKDNYSHSHGIDANAICTCIDMFEQQLFAGLTNIRNMCNEISHNGDII